MRACTHARKHAASAAHARAHVCACVQVKPCLVINKIDRLIMELQLSPAEAAERLADIVAHANMVVSSFASEAYMSEADAVLATESAREAAAAAASTRCGTVRERARVTGEGPAA